MILGGSGKFLEANCNQAIHFFHFTQQGNIAKGDHFFSLAATKNSFIDRHLLFFKSVAESSFLQLIVKKKKLEGKVP